MRKVLIVSYYFAPSSTIGAKRYGIMCKYFKENGYDPYILTAPQNTTYLGAKFDLPLPVPENKIIRVQEVQGGKSPTSLLVNWLGRLKFDSRTVNTSIFWYKSIKKSVDLKQLKDIDIVIGTYGPIGNLYAAKYLARKLKCKYIADMRDFISDSEATLAGCKRTFKLDYWIEKRLLSAADAIVTVTPELTKVMRKRYRRKKVETIYNGWDGEKEKCLNKSKEKYLYYAGSFYEERLESLKVLFRALKTANKKEEIRLVIRSIGPQFLDEKVRDMIRRMRMKDIVSIFPGTNESVVKEEYQKAYISVVLNAVHEDGIETMAALPGKTYELIQGETPVLAVSPEKSVLAKFLGYTGKGIGTISEKKIVDFILSAEGQYKGNDNVYKFSRQHQAFRLCRFMDQMLKN